jgi:hypothetical protein
LQDNVTTEPQTIPWKQLAAEAAAIVLSILLAFSIDAWWDGRKDRLEEQEILVGLEIEFVDLRDRLDRWAQSNRTGIQLIEQYLSDSVSEMDLQSIESAFFYAVAVNVLDQGGALDALLASGRLERVRNRDIRARLTKWPDWLEDIHTNDMSSRGHAMREVVPLLARNGYPQTICPVEESVFECLESGRSGPVPPAYIQLAEDPEFRAILIMRHVWMGVAVLTHESASTEAEEILAMIRDQLVKLDN